METDGFDLDAYLSRLSYDGPREPTLATLAALVFMHAATIPYENIDVLLKRGVRIDIASVQQKLVTGGRGGYCFEQNTLLESALKALGFAVTRLAGRVVRGKPAGADAPRLHKILRIDLPGGPYVVDVGFGNLTPTAPLPLRPEQAHATPHGAFRMIPDGSELMLQAQLGDAWDSLFRFRLEPIPPIDFEVANWFTSTFPQSPFIANLIVARPTATGRMTLFNRRFTVRTGDNQSTRRTLDGIDDYRDVLIEQFGLTLDEAALTEIAALMASHPADETVHPAFI